MQMKEMRIILVKKDSCTFNCCKDWLMNKRQNNKTEEIVLNLGFCSFKI